MHARIALAKTLPARPLNQPTGGQLKLIIGLFISHQIGVLAAQALYQRSRDHRIFEEATGITEHGRIGQFFAAYGAHRATDIAGGWRSYALPLQILAQGTVLQMQSRLPAQLEAHAQDQPPPRLTLEQAVAVAEGGLLKAKLAQLAGLAIQDRKGVG